MKRRNLFTWLFGAFFAPKIEVEAQIHPTIKPGTWNEIDERQKTIIIKSRISTSLVEDSKTSKNVRRHVAMLVADDVSREVERLLEEGPPDYLLDD